MNLNLTGMNTLIEQFEVVTVEEKDGLSVAHDIYKKLINDGFLPDELINTGHVADIFLIDYQYEFTNENTLTSLAADIATNAIIDSVDYETEIKEPVSVFHVVVKSMVFVGDEIQIDINNIEGHFDSMYEIEQYMKDRSAEAVDIYEEEEIEDEVTIYNVKMLALDDVKTEYKKKGYTLEYLLQFIPADVTAVGAILHTVEDEEDEFEYTMMAELILAYEEII